MEQIEQCSNPLCYWVILGYIGVLNSIKPSTNSISQYIPSYIHDILGSIIPETNHQPTGLSIAAIRACVSALTCEKKNEIFT